MSVLMNRYKTTYQLAQGDALAKVKAVIMLHSSEWDLNADALIADLLDDAHLSADDLVDFLMMTYQSEGGNAEFRAAVHTLQTALKKKHLEEVKQVNQADTEAADFTADENEDEQQLGQYFNVTEYLSHFTE